MIILIINDPNNSRKLKLKGNNSRKWGRFGCLTGEVWGKAVNSAQPKVMGLEGKSLSWDCHRLSFTKRVVLNFLSVSQSWVLHLEDAICTSSHNYNTHVQFITSSGNAGIMEILGSMAKISCQSLWGWKRGSRIMRPCPFWQSFQEAENWILLSLSEGQGVCPHRPHPWVEFVGIRVPTCLTCKARGNFSLWL